jgi:hypothetical protein
MMAKEKRLCQRCSEVKDDVEQHIVHAATDFEIGYCGDCHKIVSKNYTVTRAPTVPGEPATKEDKSMTRKAPAKAPAEKSPAAVQGEAAVAAEKATGDPPATSKGKIAAVRPGQPDRTARKAAK